MTGQDSAARALSAALDALADGTWPALAGLLEPGLRRAPAAIRPAIRRDVFCGAMATALETVLRQAGWTSTGRWTSMVLTAPDGAVVDLSELLPEAVGGGDPAPVRALLTAAGAAEAAA
ncbi:hypothetical protein [Streptomyces sp. YIM S03343]